MYLTTNQRGSKKNIHTIIRVIDHYLPGEEKETAMLVG